MIKIKHKFIYRIYSDHDLNFNFSPYERKYNYSCAMEIRNEIVLCHVSSNNKDNYISSLRELIRLKHRTFLMFCDVSIPTYEELPLGASIVDKNKTGKTNG